MTATALALLALAGCNKAESPTEVQHDVATAATSAAESNAKADESQANVDAAANKDLGEAAKDANGKMTVAAADTAITQAEGKHKVATEKCEALAGDAQKACKDEADAALAMAKAKAKAVKAE